MAPFEVAFTLNQKQWQPSASDCWLTRHESVDGSHSSDSSWKANSQTGQSTNQTSVYRNHVYVYLNTLIETLLLKIGTGKCSDSQQSI